MLSCSLLIGYGCEEDHSEVVPKDDISVMLSKTLEFKAYINSISTARNSLATLELDEHQLTLRNNLVENPSDENATMLVQSLGYRDLTHYVDAKYGASIKLYSEINNLDYIQKLSDIEKSDILTKSIERYFDGIPMRKDLNAAVRCSQNAARTHDRNLQMCMPSLLGGPIAAAACVLWADFMYDSDLDDCQALL